MSSSSSVAESRPPLVPRHNPSRHSLRSFSEQTLNVPSEPTSHSSRSSPSGERPRPDGISTPGSAVFLGDNDSTSDDQVERPPLSPVIRMSSIASARVGLGSPQLNFGREWAGGWFKGSSEVEKVRADEDGFSDEEGPEEDNLLEKDGTVLADEEAVAEETAQFLARVAVGRQSEKLDMDVLVDSVSGLPSPPRTDIGRPVPEQDGEHSRERASDGPVSSHSGTASPVSVHSSSLRRKSSLRSSRPTIQRSQGFESSVLQRRNDTPDLLPHEIPLQISPTQSESSSSSLGRNAMARRDGLTDFNGTSLQPYSLLFGDIQQEQASSPHVSPEYSSRHRHSLSVSPEPRVSNGMHNKQRNRLVEESMTHASFDDLDQRIREAEEQIHLTYSRRLRTTPSQTDNLAQSDHHTITRKDLRFHARDSPMTASGSTMKPNTTLASVSARSSTRNGTYTKHPEDEINGHEEQRQKILGGSDGKRKPLPHEFRNGGSSTPLHKTSPRGTQTVASNVSGYWRTRRVHQYESPEGQEISPLPSRFSTTSRLSRQLDSALSPSASRTFSRVSHLDGLERSSSQGNGYAPYRRQDDGSIAGLHRDSTNERDVPLNRYSQMDGRQRAESVLATHADRYRYSLSGNSTSAHMSQMPEKRRFETSLRDREVRSGSTLNLTPGDSVSALGARDDHLETGKKDPLLLLKRIEAQRARYNQQWKVDRAASVIDYHEIPRSGSRFDHTPQRVRPMSSLQNYGPVPRTAPIERQRRPLVEADSPSLERSSSRSSHAIYPLTEPRPMRSSTSAGGVYAVDMNSYKSSSDHGQLLYEAFHSLETKLPQEKLDAVAAFRSATTTTESVNSTLRTALQLAMQISIDVEVNPENVRDEFNRLILLLRDANKSSDQNVRDLTQVMLDLPKMPRETMNGRSSNEVPRRWRPVSPMTDDSPIRQRGGLLRPATSMGNYYSTSKRMSRDASSTNMTMGQDPSIRISTPPTEAEDPITTLRQDDLPDGGASPPSGSPGASVHADYNVPPPRNVEQPRNVLKKKASVMSTNTVRGSTFLPSASRVRTTTAISVVTIGDISPTRARSVISQKKSGDWDELGQFEPSTPMSKFSFQTAHESQAGSEIESDAVSLLARAAKNRNERVGAESSENQAPGGAVSRRASMSERFRATLRRNTGKQG